MNRHGANRFGLQKSYTDNDGRRLRVRNNSARAINACLNRAFTLGSGFAGVAVISAQSGEFSIDLEPGMSGRIKNARLVDEQGAEIPVRQTVDGHKSRIVIVPVSALEAGYYEFCGQFRQPGKPAKAVKWLVISAPEMAHVLCRKALANVLAVQLYAVRSPQNWGIGDFSDLKLLARRAEKAGYHYIALNPLHMTHLDEQGDISPYSPVSRVLLNWLYIDLTALPFYADDIGSVLGGWPFPLSFNETLDSVRSGTHVDYETVVPVKRWVSMALGRRFWRRYETGSLPDDMQSEFSRFLSEHSSSILSQTGLQQGEHGDFHLYTQWAAQRQLQACFPPGGKLHPIIDLAIGVKPESCEVQASPGSYVPEMSLGAPPDAFNIYGQCWNIAPFHPSGLRQCGYQPLIELLRANMPVGGGIRIDHVMWLTRQFWIPQGRPACEGGYVHFPMQEILAILRLESARRQCLVIGEDLGTVPRGFRRQLARSGIYCMKVLPFEVDDEGRPTISAPYPPLTAAFIGTHDMPLFCAVQGGRDWKNAYRATRNSMALRRPALLFDMLDDVLGETLPINIPGTIDEYPNWRRKLGCFLDEIEFLKLLGEAMIGNFK